MQRPQIETPSLISDDSSCDSSGSTVATAGIDIASPSCCSVTCAIASSFLSSSTSSSFSKNHSNCIMRSRTNACARPMLSMVPANDVGPTDVMMTGATQIARFGAFMWFIGSLSATLQISKDNRQNILLEVLNHSSQQVEI